MTLVICESEVVSVQPAARDIFRVRLAASAIADTALPGQFVMLGPLFEEFDDPFLTRPFSIHRVFPGGQVELLVAVAGRGTAAMRKLKEGQKIRLLGPQGRPFSFEGTSEDLLLLAGGLGVAPLFFLAERAVQLGKRVVFLYGAKSADRLLPKTDFENIHAECQTITDDGSSGRRGAVTDLLAEVLDRENSNEGRPWKIASCGPFEMLRKAAAIGKQRNIPVEVSLETRMACGVGACLGCVVKLNHGGKRVCVDGPVFASEEVFGP
jgi:dihydroorotate dehydrogenase electron transfer subunit